MITDPFSTMLARLAKQSSFLKRDSIKNLSSFIPKFTGATETISYNDPLWFPPESGPILSSIFADRIEIPKVRVDQYVWLDLAKWENKIAATCGITGRSYTYAKLRDSCAAFAVNVQKCGLTKGDVVGLFMPNVPEFMVAALGILEAGCTVSPINSVYIAEEISRQLINSESKLLICLVDNFEVAQKAVELTKRDIKIVCAKSVQGQPLPSGAIDFDSWIDSRNVDFSALKTYDFDLNDTAFLPYSSGTTGLPKGVMISHRNVIADSVTFEYNKSRFTLETTEAQQEVVPCVLPLYHIYGLVANFTSKLSLGTKIVTLPKFTPQTFVNMLQEHKPSMLNVVPPMVLFLGQSDLVTPKHLENVRYFVSGAAPLGPNDADAVFKKAPKAFFHKAWGMTETTCAGTLGIVGITDVSSSGYPVAGTQVKVVSLDDPDMKSLGPNETGEIYFRGATVMKGYLNNERATNETLVKNRWLSTGDIGNYDESGKVFVTDRLKELIKVKGFQVAPAELEAVLRSHPSVAEAAVLAVPHERSGEVPRAFVVAKANKTINTADIFKFLESKVTSYKIPDQIVVTDSIPKSPSGKILRREVKLKFGLV